MNKSKRLKLKDIIKSLETSLSLLIDVKEEEEDSYNNLPENFQESERGEQMMENIERMETAESLLDEACDLIQNACEELNDI